MSEEVKERAWPLETAEEMKQIAKANDKLPSATVIQEIRNHALRGRVSANIPESLFTGGTITLLEEKGFHVNIDGDYVTVSWRGLGINK